MVECLPGMPTALGSVPNTAERCVLYMCWLSTVSVIIMYCMRLQIKIKKLKDKKRYFVVQGNFIFPALFHKLFQNYVWTGWHRLAPGEGEPSSMLARAFWGWSAPESCFLGSCGSGEDHLGKPSTPQEWVTCSALGVFLKEEPFSWRGSSVSLAEGWEVCKVDQGLSRTSAEVKPSAKEDSRKVRISVKPLG